MKTSQIAALVSGGVDSSVALALLKDQGFNITAFYIKIWLEDDNLQTCPWKTDLEYVKNVCQKLDIPLKIINLQKEYYNTIITYTLNEAKAGRTPNPDILCNQHIKFGAFLDSIDKSYDDKAGLGKASLKIATGHYAQIIDGKLLRAPDPVKDQTFFLANLSKKQLSRAIFPIGHLNKAEVRKLAGELNLPNKNRKDSQGLCFLGKFKFSDFIEDNLGTKEGDILEIESNEKIGTHNGHWFYTIGQRRNLRLSGGPWYVVKKDAINNIVYISKNYNLIEEQRKSFTVSNCNWISKPTKEDLTVKIRHKMPPKRCTLINQQVTFYEKDQGIAPGQFAVFYDGNQCLGSCVID